MAGSIQYIKISKTDNRGIDMTSTLESLENIVIPSGSTNLTYKVNNISGFSNYFLYNVTAPTTTNLSTGITSSIQYNVLTTLQSFVNVTGVGFLDDPKPFGFGTINLDPLNLMQQVFDIHLSERINAFSPPTDLQQQNDFHIRLIATGSSNRAGGTATGTAFIELVKADSLEGIYTPRGGSGITLANAVITPGNNFQIDISANSSLNFGEAVYLRCREATGNFNATELYFTNSSVQITSSFYSGSDKPDIVLEPFFESRFIGSDCDVLAGNAFQPVANPFLQDIDYSKGSIIPVNNLAIISGSATRGTVPESYYTALSSINLKYNGSKNQSSNFNVYNPLAGTSSFGDPINIGTYGKTSPVEVSSNYVIYYKSSTGNQGGGSFGTIFQTFDLSYIITPGGELIEITNEQNLFEQLQQSFMPTPLPNPLPGGSQDGPVTFKVLSFATGSSFVGEYTGISRVYIEELEGSVKLDLYTSLFPTSSGTDIIPLLPSLNPQISSSGGLIFATSIEYSEIPDLPSRAREILTKNNIISPSN